MTSATNSPKPDEAAPSTSKAQPHQVLEANVDPQPTEAENANPSKPNTPSASPAESTESRESGEASPDPSTREASQSASAPPLPSEPVPESEDDGWDYHWDATHQAYFFYNRITNESTWENPRTRTSDASAPAATPAAPSAPGVPELPKNEKPPAGGYNPAIHGDYDPNAWYAQPSEGPEAGQATVPSTEAAYAAIGSFNRFTGRWQADDQNPDKHNDESKSRRQMNAFFDVDAAANSHDGRSLKAERSGKKPSKTELKQFKEKRRARKEEKRRAWLLD
ncbi:WW domain-containing protein [Apiospora hydei]|uniref:WW domain-containing protein n=1 Tax=Apiospora hydei TaxID=1337664 RepID=A0ABR1X945_9PEZI